MAGRFCMIRANDGARQLCDLRYVAYARLKRKLVLCSGSMQLGKTRVCESDVGLMKLLWISDILLRNTS